MTVRFEYNKKQVIQALRYHFLNRPEIKILLIIVNVFAILSAILLYFKIIQAISFLFFSILWFLLMLVIWRVLPGSIYRRSATFKDHFTMHFDEDQVMLETDRGNKGWSWKTFTHFVESHIFFIYTLMHDHSSWFPKTHLKTLQRSRRPEAYFAKRLVNNQKMQFQCGFCGFFLIVL